ncbi:GNAT family N-acetyltransferase [Floricoccus penangensis]|uniref:GNAT family N-acetyltransferase n=1 Tax=Floricoccus penangensis TaxID=1859475 RepID=UPI00203C3982|nr:GNAT family N-acetyltransferase [Floricoccus penangensis]URZ86925.1 GNAT family N-acetyltransferase [Floricoccus penangensis]
MIEYKTSENLDTKQVLDLYENVGWILYTRYPEKLMQAMEQSLFILEAWENERLIGLVRVVGDGLTIIYIQDLLVLEDYQGQGIGSQLLFNIFDKYSSVRQKVLLTDDTIKTRKFYEKLGMHSTDDGYTLGFYKSN